MALWPLTIAPPTNRNVLRHDYLQAPGVFTNHRLFSQLPLQPFQRALNRSRTFQPGKAVIAPFPLFAELYKPRLNDVAFGLPARPTTIRAGFQQSA